MLATELRNFYSIQVKKEMLQIAKENLADAVEIGSNTVSAGVIKMFFQFVESALTNKTNHGLFGGIV